MRRLLKNRKGFTLVELIVVMALLAVLAVGLSATISFGAHTYINTRTDAQAVSLANDLINGFKEELKFSTGAYIEHNDQTELGANLAFSSESAYASYGRRIFLDMSNYRVICQNRDNSQADTLKSKYYTNLKIKNLKFETANNLKYETTGGYGSGQFAGNVFNIVKISFQVYDSNNTLRYEVIDYHIELERMITLIFDNFTGSNIDYDKLVIKKEDLGGLYNSDIVDFRNPLNLNADFNLINEHYNMLYYIVG